MAFAETTKLFHMVAHPLADCSVSWGRVLREGASVQGFRLGLIHGHFTRFYQPEHIIRPIHMKELEKLTIS